MSGSDRTGTGAGVIIFQLTMTAALILGQRADAAVLHHAVRINCRKRIYFLQEMKCKLQKDAGYFVKSDMEW